MGEILRCLHCARVTALLEAGARHVGWRIYRGKTMSGREMVDVVCPVCSGRGPDPGPPTWDVECRFCHWKFTDDWQLTSDAVLTAWQTMNVIKDHNFRCQGWDDSTDYLVEYRVLDPADMTWSDAESPRFLDKVQDTAPMSKGA